MAGGTALEKFQVRIGYRFGNAELLEAACMHGSAVQSGGQSNQRLEFLGDAVLSVAASDALYRWFPSASPGELSRMRESFVNNGRLAEVAESLGLGPCLRVGKGGKIVSKMLADGFEAVLGAAYLDGGMRAVASIVERHLVEKFRDRETPPAESGLHPKTALQEWLQARGHQLPSYRLIGGPERKGTRECAVEVTGGGQTARARSESRKAAESKAADLLLACLAAVEAANPPLAGGPAAEPGGGTA